MRVPNAVHEAHPWVIREVAPDFRLLDVWALPVEGERDEFGRVLDVGLRSFDPAGTGGAARALFAVRDRIGAVLGWDDAKPRPIPGCRETTLRERLPAHLAGSADGAKLGDSGFTPLYRTADEWAAEISNATVHGVLHLTWVDRGDGRHRAHLAVYVLPRGRLGAAYLKAIEPFRHYVVYPALLKHVGAVWAARERGVTPRAEGASEQS
ncbi:MAG TPA: DUF2867 domain-containing protein [Frankiaceae bacterium]|nr:DUF2867 domain-containing protein [Frankiaceae bacterium]